jgi:putative transposase
MAHYNTILNQMAKLFSRHEFELLAKKYHTGRKMRKITRWEQFISMLTGQISGRNSLRDLLSNLCIQSKKLYHLGFKKIPSRTTLARTNTNKSYLLYEELFNQLLKKCRTLAPKHKFRFKNKLYSLDATTIDLCLSLFEWADFRATKGGIKLNVGLDHDGYLPSFISIKEASNHEVKWAQTLNLSKGSIITFDKGFTSYAWYSSLINKGIMFVTRLKTNASYRVIKSNTPKKYKGVMCDQIIKFNGLKGNDCPHYLRRIKYKDFQTGKTYVYLTNIFHLSSKTIADIYKERWQIEIFFKWIKQNLKIKSFLGTSKNAVLTQVWIAMCVYLLLCWIKWSQKLNWSLQKMIRILQMNLFQKYDLFQILKEPDKNTFITDDFQLQLALS